MDQKLEIILSAKDLTQKAFLSASAQVQRFTKNVFSMRGALVATAGAAAMGAFVRKSIETADEIGKMADTAGISTDALQELRHAARLSGLETGILDRAMGAFSKRLGEARLETGALSTFLKKYDLSLLENLKNTKSTNEALDIFFEALSNTATASDRAALASAAFSRSGMRTVIMVKDGIDGLRKMRQEARDLGIVMDEQLIRQSERANDEIEKLTRVIKVQFMSAAVGLAPEIAKIAQSTTDWWKANQGMIKTDVAQWANKTKNAILGIKKIYDDLPEGVVGAAGVGLIVAIIGRSGPLGALAAAIALTSSKISQFKRDHPEIFKPERGFSGVTGSWGPPETETPTPKTTVGIPFDFNLYNKELAAFYDKAKKAYLAEQKALQKEVEKYQKEFQDALIMGGGTGAIMEGQLRRGVGQYLDQTVEDTEKIKDAYAAMYGDLRFESSGFYEWQKEQYRQQADAWAKTTGDMVTPYQWFIQQVNALDQERLDAAGETNQMLIELSERTSDAMEQTFSDAIYDLKDGWKDWQSYFRKLSDSMWRITSDIVGQMVKEWLFGTAKTTAALATEGAQVGVLIQLYYQLAAAKALAGGLGGISSSFGDMGSLSNIAKYGGGSFMARQHGGDVLPGKRYIIGEKGWEIFEPKVPGYIIPHHQAVNEKSSQSNEYNINIPMTVNAQDDDMRASRIANRLQYEFEEIARRIMREEMR